MWARSSQGAGRLVDQGPHDKRGSAHAESRIGDAVGAYRITTIAARDGELIAPHYKQAQRLALDPDPFLQPAAIAAAVTHEPALRDLRLVCIWHDGVLCGLFPLKPAGGILRERRWELPLLDACATGAPFLNRDHAAPVLAALRTWLAGRGLGLHFAAVANRSAFRTLLEADAACGKASVRKHDRSPGGSAADPDGLRTPAPGGMVLDRVSEPAALRQAVEDFLLHESLTASGQGRNALLQSSGAANRIRALTRSLGPEKLCQAFVLRDAAGAKAVALILYAHGKAVLWRLATDPQAQIPQDWLRARVMRAIAQRRDTEVHDGVGDHGLAGGDAGRISARYAPRLEKPLAQGSTGLSRRLSDAWRGRTIPTVHPAPERGASSPARPSSAPGGAKRAKLTRVSP